MSNGALGGEQNRQQLGTEEGMSCHGVHARVGSSGTRSGRRKQWSGGVQSPGCIKQARAEARTIPLRTRTSKGATLRALTSTAVGDMQVPLCYCMIGIIHFVPNEMECWSPLALQPTETGHRS